MSDGSIRDDQVKVSSEQALYPASGVRPYHKGWCASVHDASPTVTVSTCLTKYYELYLVLVLPNSCGSFRIFFIKKYFTEQNITLDTL